jgi:putative serine protease PepD
MTTNVQPGSYTPDFRDPQASNEEATVVLPTGQYGSYTGTDFPAPPGVPPLAPNPAPAPGFQRPKRRVGAMIGGAAMAAVLGAGAGIGSYAFLVDHNPSGVSVTSAAAPSPTLDGTVSAAAAKIEPSLVTIAVQASNGSGIGSGMVLDKDGHILTNNHVVAGAGNGAPSR